MSQNKRQIILGILLLTLLGVSTAWCYGHMSDQRTLARDAILDLEHCQRLAESIVTLSQKPAVASTAERGVQELGLQIDRATTQAKLDGAVLEGVFPQSARRVGDTPYLTKPTSLVMRNVPLKQLVAFLYHLGEGGEGGAGLTVRDLRLRTPHNLTNKGAWDVEVTVTYLIYAPPPETPVRK